MSFTLFHPLRALRPPPLHPMQSFLPQSDALELTYGVFGAFLFSGFIVVDTQRLMYRVSVDEYIICAIDLYLDIINLFIRILEIMGKHK